MIHAVTDPHGRVLHFRFGDMPAKLSYDDLQKLSHEIDRQLRNRHRFQAAAEYEKATRMRECQTQHDD